MYLRWPCTTAKRHVSNIQNNQAAVVALLTLYPYAGPSIRGLVRGVNAPRDSSRVDEARVPSCRFIDELNEAFRWIRSSKEVKVAIEVRHVVVLQDIASYAYFKKGRSRSECGETHRQDVERGEDK